MIAALLRPKTSVVFRSECSVHSNPNKHYQVRVNISYPHCNLHNIKSQYLFLQKINFAVQCYSLQINAMRTNTENLIRFGGGRNPSHMHTNRPRRDSYSSRAARILVAHTNISTQIIVGGEK